MTSGLHVTDLGGATQTGPDYAYPSSPGEFAARWNSWPEERREEFLARIVDRDVTASRCFQEDHDGLKWQLKYADRILGRVHGYIGALESASDDVAAAIAIELRTIVNGDDD